MKTSNVPESEDYKKLNQCILEITQYHPYKIEALHQSSKNQTKIILKKIAVMLLAFLPFYGWAQNNNVGIGTTTPDASAILELQSSDKGFLVPRLNVGDALNSSPVTSPTTGLLIWNTNNAIINGKGVGFYFWDGGAWIPIDSEVEIDPEVDCSNTNFVPFWDGSKLTDGSILDKGLDGIGIGVTSPNANLDVDANTSNLGSAVKGQGVGNAKGFLGVEGGNSFDGSYLDAASSNIGVLGIATEDNANDNYGVVGFSDGWAGRFVDVTMQNDVFIGDEEFGIKVLNQPISQTATPNISQSSENNYLPNGANWQTFKTTVSGKLDFIKLKIRSPQNLSASDVTVTVFEGSGTTGPVLGTATVIVASGKTPNFEDFDFANQPFLKANRTYTFEVSTPAAPTTLFIRASDANPYADGRAYMSAWDIAFRLDLFHQVSVAKNAFVVKGDNVGIGTDAPTEKLDIDGGIKIDGELNTSGSAGTIGFLLKSNGPGTAPSWVSQNAAVSNMWTLAALGHVIYNNNDLIKVGLGTNNPSNELHISKTGTASIWLEANKSNTNSSGKSYLRISRNNATRNAVMGFSPAFNQSPTGSTLTDAIQDVFVFSSTSGYQFATGGTVHSTLNVNGELGLGTTTPQNTLHIRRSSTEASLFLEANANSTLATNRNPYIKYSGYGGINTAISGFTSTANHLPDGTYTPPSADVIGGALWIGTTSSNRLQLGTNGNTRLNIESDGDIGINTTNNTKAIFEVHQAKSVVPNPFGGSHSYFGQTGTMNTGQYTSHSLSIWAQYGIAGNAIFAFSDERIKKIKGISNAENDLKNLMEIEIVDYKKIDTLSDNTAYKKVIAQQVAEVYPIAVQNNLTDVVPDIYQKADLKNGWIELSTDLKVGERVKIITEEAAEVYEVVEVKSSKFRVKEQLSVNGQQLTVFVFGREVDDFHTVDYEAIAMLNVSATQEQQRLIEELQKRNTQLEAKLIENVRETNALKAEMAEVKAMLGLQVSNR